MGFTVVAGEWVMVAGGDCGFAGFTVFVFVFDFGGWVVVVVGVVWLLWVWAMGLWGE